MKKYVAWLNNYLFTWFEGIKTRKSIALYSILSAFAASLLFIMVYFLSTLSGFSNPNAVAETEEGEDIWNDYFSVVVKKGNSFTDTLTDAGISRRDAANVSKSVKEVVNLKKINAGHEIVFAIDDKNSKDEIKLASLKISEGDKDIEVTRDEKGNFVTKEIQKKTRKAVLRGGSVIESSLYQAGVDKGVPANVMLEMIKAYSYDVDFQRDIKNGDSFEVLYEAQIDEKGRRVKGGTIIYASLDVDGKPVKIYRHTTKTGDTDYFDENGKSIKKALLRTPINGARISSRFGVRMHPIMGYSKMHKGVDFAASTGTPIYAAGNGTIDFLGKKNGYGNYIKLRHSSDYATAYGHISKFAKGIKRGSRVKQGEVIAYVGSTGQSTGPHLHYETIYRGEQVNPMKIKNVPGVKLAGGGLKFFKKQKKQIDLMLASLPLNGTTKMAMRRSIDIDTF